MGLKIVIHTGYQRVNKISLTAMPAKGECPKGEGVCDLTPFLISGGKGCSALKICFTFAISPVIPSL
jgi:hypothetical protein